MKQLRVRLLILFTSTGTLMTAGHFDNRPPQFYVLDENHLILRPDQVEEAPQAFVAEADELLPAVEADETFAALAEAPAPITEAELAPAVEGAAEEATTEEPLVELAWGPTRLGDKKRVKTYLAATTEPTTVAPAIPVSLAKSLPVERKPVPAAPRAPASVPRPTTARPVYVAASRASPVAIGKAQPAVVECRLELESPNGGEELSQSVGERVLWKSSGVAGRVRLKLMKGEEDLGTVTVVQDDGSTLVRISDLIEPGPGYRLRIEAAKDPSCFDESDAEFSIKP